MDWEQAIEINRAALRRVVAQLFALLELALEGPLRRLPRPLYSEAERLLTPAEFRLAPPDHHRRARAHGDARPFPPHAARSGDCRRRRGPSQLPAV